jgi:tetratricopeptide (TPR) repeat protein
VEDQHLTPELLDALVRKELPPLVLSGLTWKHLLAVCPDCAAGVEAWQSRVAGKHSYDAAFEGAQRRVDEEVARAAEASSERKARRELQDLLRTEAPKRSAKVRRGSKRFRNLALANLLLDECIAHLNADPREALAFAQLAREVALRATEPGSDEQAVTALAWVGNCLRACGSLPEATEAIAAARSELHEKSLTDPLVFADLDRFEGMLLKDRRLLAEAESLLSRSKLIYRLTRQQVNVNRALLVLSSVHKLQGRLDEALNDLHEACRSIDREKNPYLYLAARHNLATLYYEHGEIEAARSVLEDMREEYDRSDNQIVVLQRTWLEGRIARGEERFQEAERFLQRAAVGFEKLEIGYDTALVALDLAELYLAEGKSAAVKGLAERLQPVLAFSDLHQEAIAALVLFQNAAAQELANTAMLKRLRERLEEMRALPRASTDGEA